MRLQLQNIHALITAATLYAAVGCTGSSIRENSSGSAGSAGVAGDSASGPGGAGATPVSPPVATSTPPVAGRPSLPPIGQAGANAGAPAVAPQPDDDAGVSPAATDAGTPNQGRVACSTNAYVTNSGSDSVSIIDTATHEVSATIPTGKAPVNPVFTPDHRHVYVANSQADTITVIDVLTNEATSIPAGGERPSGLAFSPDGRVLYVSLISADYVSPGSFHSIDLATGKTSPPIQMGADPERIALTLDGSRLFIDNLLDGTMAVIDTAMNKVIATVMLGDLPFNPLMSKDGTVVYVGVMSANHIAVVDANTYQI